ncbi:hypothetical protein GW17_00016078 [Ensete ventricosum]|nr:hypothetical protein GW17_00016078 [Ensete ventricosum]
MVRAVRVSVNHRIGTYRPYRAVRKTLLLFGHLYAYFPQTVARKKKRREERISHPRAVLARGSPARRHRSLVACGRCRFFSCIRRRSVSPRREKARGDYRYQDNLGTSLRIGIAFSVSSRGEKELPAGDSSLAGDESRKRSVSPREEKESPAGDSSPAGNESCGRPVGNGRCGELHVKVCFSFFSLFFFSFFLFLPQLIANDRFRW